MNEQDAKESQLRDKAKDNKKDDRMKGKEDSNREGSKSQESRDSRLDYDRHEGFDRRSNLEINQAPTISNTDMLSILDGGTDMPYGISPSEYSSLLGNQAVISMLEALEGSRIEGPLSDRTGYLETDELGEDASFEEDWTDKDSEEKAEEASPELEDEDLENGLMELVSAFGAVGDTGGSFSFWEPDYQELVDDLLHLMEELPIFDEPDGNGDDNGDNGEEDKGDEKGSTKI